MLKQAISSTIAVADMTTVMIVHAAGAGGSRNRGCATTLALGSISEPAFASWDKSSVISALASSEVRPGLRRPLMDSHPSREPNQSRLWGHTSDLIIIGSHRSFTRKFHRPRPTKSGAVTPITTKGLVLICTV